MILEVKRVSKQYLRAKKAFYALEGVSLNVRKGEAVSIVGPSGSGKSTLLNIVAGLLTPTDGEVFFDGTNLFGLSDAKVSALRNARIGCLPQGGSLLANLNVIENVCLPHYLGGRNDDCYPRARELLREVGLEKLERAYPAEMSGGEMLRAALARTLINSPELIVADEPTSDLDNETAHEIMRLLMSFNKKGAALLMVTHDLEMSRYCGSVYRIVGGKSQPA